jgi:hypothetical protein
MMAVKVLSEIKVTKEIEAHQVRTENVAKQVRMVM